MFEQKENRFAKLRSLHFLLKIKFELEQLE
jgi:hypothetical protein